MAPDQQDFLEDDIPTMSAVEIADWRLRTFALYDKVRQLAATNPFDAHVFWRQERDLMFATHPASALTADMKASFSGLRTAGYDPAFRRYAVLSPDGSGQEMNVETGTDGVVPFVRIGTFELAGMGSLAVWRLRSYGGGIFVPFRDATAGKDGGSYGAGRYLLDTVKGSFHGTRSSSGEQEFILDFNFAYNPSCAYNEAWACPLAGPDNRLATDVPVGELYLG
ncbi:DUF1684 domain-containing protein [Paenarthrobacter sp. CM16]|uniref:DUF1684 domain-containing protein n=1 Tax=Paenarthrobacter sp. CM16 TaxID=2738447 RepID=UPI001557EE4C|nr:DUF1684 domain-containing protein [Paenarthrobacter sp. CM16]NQD90162.1 DUF1684 domain-containing protein [Paenarthrobacter sp. CM16]